jgi:hypothetical protein
MFKLRTFLLVACVGTFLLMATASDVSARGRCGQPCCVSCCQPCPPPVKMVLCVKDPCTCCTHHVCVCVPACCKDSEICVSWRRGFFGRRIATYTWVCCGHSVDVVITRFRGIIVRG